jgi:hypothetical protein
MRTLYAKLKSAILNRPSSLPGRKPNSFGPRMRAGARGSDWMSLSAEGQLAEAM